MDTLRCAHLGVAVAATALMNMGAVQTAWGTTGGQRLGAVFRGHRPAQFARSVGANLAADGAALRWFSLVEDGAMLEVEPQRSVLDWLDVGALSCRSLGGATPLPDATTFYTTLHTAAGPDEVLGLGLQARLTGTFQPWEAPVSTWELQPVVSLAWGPWSVAWSPVLTAEGAVDVPVLAPNLQSSWTLSYELEDLASLSLEHRMDLGSTDALSAPTPSAQTLSAAVSVPMGPVDARFAVGAGSNQWVATGTLLGNWGQ